MTTSKQISHQGPNAGILAIIFMILFNIGLSFVITFNSSAPHYPGPWEAAGVIVHYFQTQAHAVLLCAFFQFLSAIPLGIFTATMVNQLSFLGNKAVGKNIALFGGFFTAFNVSLSAMLMWVMAYPQITSDGNIIRALFYISFIIGGIGYSVPLGLLFAGLSVSAWFMKALPKWLILSGMLLALVGVLSSFYMIVPGLLFLIPLTRFPGFIWLIIAGFMLPSKKPVHPKATV